MQKYKPLKCKNHSKTKLNLFKEQTHTHADAADTLLLLLLLLLCTFHLTEIKTEKKSQRKCEQSPTKIRQSRLQTAVARKKQEREEKEERAGGK